MNNKDSRLNSERLVEKTVERNIQNTKSKVKPILPTPQTMSEVNRNKVIERRLPKGAIEYEMLLIQMEEGTLCKSPKPADSHAERISKKLSQGNSKNTIQGIIKICQYQGISK